MHSRCRLVALAVVGLLVCRASEAFAPLGRSTPAAPSALTHGRSATTGTRPFSSVLFSVPIKQDETKPTAEKEGKITSDVTRNNGSTNTKLQDAATTSAPSIDPNADGLPWWWELVWKLDVMQKGEPGAAVTFGDSANVLRTNIEQIYGGYPSLDGCPLAEGELGDIAEGTMFVGLQNYYDSFGSPYKLCFGPKSFLVVSDPVQAKHILRDANKNYDKGVLAEILEPIMGKGLIPADPETWSVRRRQIVPAFHKAWLEHMVGLFGYCNQPLIEALNNAASGNGKAEMETFFCSVALDIIGLSVFNYNFGSVTKESPVIKAVYSALVEAEHRSMTPAPYWDLPLANQLVPRLRKFNADLRLLNNVLDDLIVRAKNTRQVEDIEELERRNYDEVQDPSLLRFLVDMRGADIDNKQLRDDLMTMLIAGHETTAAVLTWALFELTKNQDIMVQAQEEIERVLGDRTPTYSDIKYMKFLRLIVAETLRMYPEPPLLIRRCRTEDYLPAGGGREATVIRGMDMFMAVYNIHRDERFWPEPDKFDPMRFTRPYKNPDVPGWEGFDPAKWEGKLYPNEVASDFAFLPFGGGARKCVGDEFAILEATVTLAMVLRRFSFEFDPDMLKGKSDLYSHPKDLNHPVGMKTGATIHTRNGLHLIVKKREV
jgi:cytochrome P450 family 97 subfamily B polypeptide 3